MTATGRSRERPGLEELSIRGQVRRLRRLAGVAAARFALPGATLHFISHWENTTFRIESPDAVRSASPPGFRPGRYLLRLHRPENLDADMITSELVWLRALRARDFIVPEPVATPDGAHVVELSHPAIPDRRLATVLRWVDGRHHKKADVRFLVRVGGLMARLHQHAAAWSLPPGFTRPVQSSRSLLSPAPSGHEAIHRGLMGYIAHVLDAMDTEWQRSLIHGDLHLGNAVFRAGSAHAIDFDDCRVGYHLWDIATALNAYRERADWEMIRDAFLGEYRRTCPLPTDCLQWLDYFMGVRRWNILVWMVDRARVHPGFAGEIAPRRTDLVSFMARYLGISEGDS